MGITGYEVENIELTKQDFKAKGEFLVNAFFQ